MKHSILTSIVLACALCLGASQDVYSKEGGKRRADRGTSSVDAVLAKLNLSDEQKSKIQAIQEKFRTEIKKWEQEHKAEIDAARSGKDRAKMRTLMEQRKTKMEGMMAEIKGVLTEDQKVQFQQALDAAKAEHGKRGEKRRKK